MALLSELPVTKINSSEIYREAWKRHCDDFEISSQRQMMEKSHLDKLVTAIREIIDKEKVEILLRKPLNAIINAGTKIKSDIDNEISLCKADVDNYSQPDDEIEERITKLGKAEKRLNKKVEALDDAIESELKTVVRRGKVTLEDDLDSACNRLDDIVEDLGRFQDVSAISAKLDRQILTLRTRTLKRDTEEIGIAAKSVLKKCVSDFINEASDVMLRYAPEFDANSFLKSLNNEIEFTIDDTSVFNYEQDEEDSEETWIDSVFKFIGDYLNGMSLGVLGKIGNALSHNDTKKELHDYINGIRKTDVSEFVDTIMGNKDAILKKAKESVIDNMLKPLQEQLKEVVANKEQKQQKLVEAKGKLEKLEADKAVIEKQLKEFN